MPSQRQFSPKQIATFYLIIYEFLSFLQPIYADTDSYILSLVVNKAYGNTNTTIFMNPILCKIFEAIHNLLPYGDAYEIVGEILMSLAVWTIIYLTLVHTQNTYEKIALCLILTLALFWKEARIYENFTDVAAFLTSVGIISLAIQVREKKKNIRFIIIGTILILAGMMWRQNAALLGLPFMFLDLIFFYFHNNGESKQRKIKEILKVYGLAWIGILFLYGVNYWYNLQIPDAVAYNSARSALVDYHPIAYDQISNPSFSKNDYDCMLNMILGDTEYITSNFLTKIAVASDPTKPNFLNFETFLYTIFGLKIYCFSWLVLSIIALITIILFHKKDMKKVCLHFGLPYLGLFCICYGFVYIGRLTISVLAAIYMYALLITTVTFTYDYKSTLEWNKKDIKQGFFVITCLSLIFGYRIATMRKAESFQASFMANYHSQEDINKWKGDTNIYFWDPYEFSTTFAKPFFEKGKLYPREALEKNIQLGEWTYNQPYFDEYLERIHIHNPMKTLLENDNAYFIGPEKSAEMLLLYYKEHFTVTTIKREIESEEIGSMWSFQKAALSQ